MARGRAQAAVAAHPWGSKCSKLSIGFIGAVEIVSACLRSTSSVPAGDSEESAFRRFSSKGAGPEGSAGVGWRHGGGPPCSGVVYRVQ